MYASLANQVGIVDFLVKRNAAVTLQDANGQTALHLAAANNSIDSLKILIRAATEILIKDFDGRTPLHLASLPTNIRCLELLLRRVRSNELNDGDNEKMTVLHWCAYNNNSEGVKKLLQCGADIVMTDIEGKTALHWTANNGDDKTIKEFLEKTPTAVNLKDSYERTALHLAVSAGNVPVILALLNAPTIRADVSAVDKDFRTPLHWAAVMGLSHIVGILMENGADPLVTDGTGATPLRYAALRNHEETVETLLSFDITQDIPDKDGQTALMVAAERGNYVIVKKMIERNVDINVQDLQGSTALHLAAYSGHSEICQLLAQHGGDINAVDGNGHTPLFRACERGNSNVVLVLLQHNASVLLMDGNGQTCLHWAASNGSDFIVTTLIHNGIPVDAVDDGGRSALHCASFAGSVACCSELVNANNTIVNQIDNEGVSPLHWACAGGHIDCVQFLLTAGANLNSMDYTGQQLTPLDYSIVENHQEVAQYLIAEGALTIASIQELAATLIQKVYRGYTTRKQLAVMKQSKIPDDKTPTPVAKVDTLSDEESLASSLQRKELEELKMAQVERQIHEWSLKSPSTRALQTQLARKDKQRMTLHRKKTHAALVIQYCWRRYKRRKYYREIEEIKRKARQQLGLDHWRCEIAALVIQLAWRQYQRRKLLHQTMRRRRMIHQWTPSVMAAKQRMLVERVYGQEMKTVDYQPPKPRPMVRPAYLGMVDSPAAVSFNFAIQQYQVPSPQYKVF
jgi:inversin